MTSPDSDCSRDRLSRQLGTGSSGPARLEVQGEGQKLTERALRQLSGLLNWEEQISRFDELVKSDRAGPSR
ncbi:MAG: hypothetical protein ABSA96_21060 [Candidatus Acidiferrales bacterium]